MARPRIRQFAGDMGIGYDDAKDLINKGRRRKDGGSQVLESNMNKMRGYQKGGTEKMTRPTPLTEAEKRYRDYIFDPDISEKDKQRMRDNPQLADPDHAIHDEGMRPEEKSMGKKRPKLNLQGEVSAADGKYMSCRGMGKAIQGTKFSGVK